MEKLISRKFIFAIAVLIVGIVFVYTGKVSGDSWLTFSEIIGGTYIAGNVAEKITDAVGERG